MKTKIPYDPATMHKRVISLNQELTEIIDELQPLAEKMCEKEKEYKIMLSQEVLKLRNEGLAVSLIKDVVAGLKGVAEAKFQRDFTKELFVITKEKLKGKIINIDSLRSILTWCREEMKRSNIQDDY